MLFAEVAGFVAFGAEFVGGLDGVGLDDGADEAGETAFDFSAAGGVVDFDAAAFRVDEAGFTEDAEVLGEGGFGDGLVADGEELRAGLGAVLGDDIGVNGYAHGVREGVKDALYGELRDGRVEEGAHTSMRWGGTGKRFVCLLVHKNGTNESFMETLPSTCSERGRMAS